MPPDTAERRPPTRSALRTAQASPTPTIQRGSKPQAPLVPASGFRSADRRREYLLARLREADGPQYDALCAEVAAAFPAKRRYRAAAQAVRAVRGLLWDQLATVDADGAIWLLPAAWKAAA
jgi:hypothetical protein